MGFRFRTTASDGKHGRRGAATTIGVIFLIISTIVVVIAMGMRAKSLEERRWNLIPCQIARSSYVLPNPNSNDGYQFDVEFRYDINGVTHSGNQYKRGDTSEPYFEPIQRLILRYPVNSPAMCYVNPENADDAALALPDASWMVMVILALIFGGVGVLVLAGTWLFPKAASATSRSPMASDGNSPGKFGKLVGCLFFSIFLLVGLLVCFVWSVPTWIASYRSLSWPKVPATVVMGRVISHSDSDGTTYSVDLLYRYEIDGATYLSNNRDFVRGSSSGQKSKRDFINQHPPRSLVDAYVDPQDPVDVVLEPGFSASSLVLCFPLIFVLVGGGGILGILLFGKSNRSSNPSPLRNTMPPARSLSSTSASGISQFNGAKGRKGKFIFMLCFGLFWNGIVWTIGYFTMREGSASSNICPLIFFALFALIGLALLGGIVHTFLSLFNPTTQIELSRSEICLGDSITIKWTIGGRFDRISVLRITLEGTESATYRRGTDTHTDHQTFYKHVIVEASKAVDIQRGQKALNIPIDTMHSFKATSNEIKWSLRIHGDIPNWPDVRDEIALQILPVRQENIQSEPIQ